MSRRLTAILLPALTLAATYGAPTATARPAPSARGQAVTVRGQLTGAKGYTLVLASSSGAGRSVRLSAKGSFALSTRTFGGGLTLSLVAPSGRYWGPVTLHAARKSGVYLTLQSRRTISLGRITRGRTVAQVRRPLPAAAVDTSRRVRVDRRGVPVGAGRVGLIKLGKSGRVVHGPEAPADGAAALGSDSDGDGIINAYDLDDDGDGVLDSSDPDAGPAHNQLGFVFTNTWAEDLVDSLNVDATEVTTAQIDQLVKNNLSAALIVDTQSALPGQTLQSVDVDCFKLPWCASAEIDPSVLYGPNPGTLSGPWSSYDPNGDGRPNLVVDPRRPESGIFTMGVYPRAAASAMRPDDAISFHIVTNAGQGDYATTFGPFFVTTPALASVGSTEIHYPVAAGDPGTGGSASSAGHPIQLSSFTVPFQLWRPQRLTVPGAESGTFMDMGHLNYMVEKPLSPDGRGCPASSYSAPTPTLSPSGDGYYEWLSDSAADAPPNPENKVGFTVDFAACAGGASALAGKVIPLGIDARTVRGENASEKIWVQFPDV